MSSETLTTSDAPWRLPSSRKVAMILVITTELALFVILVVAYFFYIGKSSQKARTTWKSDQEEPMLS